MRKSIGVGAELGQQLRDQPVLLLCQCRKQMLLLYGVVGIFNGKALCALQSLQRFLGKLVRVHKAYLLYLQIRKFAGIHREIVLYLAL